ncbi:InlB B-repeat-containing protein [Faecalibaculum rodentium]|uniref:InlB B-repeat-containing protein n=1 Tax=Faecalibaculum rodentium TaxID=1702221 RepID=UPI0023EFAA29|nr:InlB B-repeat-containing protein [Faecalibaculum rodentium]
MIRKKHITLCFSLFLALSMVLGQLIPVTATDEVPAEAPATVEEPGTPAPETVQPDPELEAGGEPDVTPTVGETPDQTGEGGSELTAPAGDGQGEEPTIPTVDVTETTEEGEVAKPEEEGEQDYFGEADGVKVKAVAAKGAFPEGAILKVAKLDPESAEYKKAAETLDSQNYEYSGFVAMDIHFEVDGQEVEPAADKGDVRVELQVDKKELPQENAAEAIETLEVQHHEEQGAAVTAKPVAKAADNSVVEAGQEVKADFAVGNFSTFTITWTTSAWWGQSTQRALISVQTVDENGADLNVSRPDLTVDSGNTITISDYAPKILGYKYLKSYIKVEGTSREFTKISFVDSRGSYRVEFNTTPEKTTYNYSNSTINQPVYIVYSKVENGTVKFNRNGGSGTNPEAITGKIGNKVKLPSYEGTRNGYTFAGWAATSNTSSTDGYKVYKPGELFEIEDEEVTLYAVWNSSSTSDGYFFIRKDGKIPQEPGQYTVGEYTSEIHISEAVKNHFWTWDVDVTGKAVVGNHLDNTVTAQFEPDKLPSDKQIKDVLPTYDLKTEYIHWYVQKYSSGRWHIDGVVLKRDLVTVTYDRNCNDLSVTPPMGYQVTRDTNITIGVSGQPQGVITTISRDGYTFVGWNTKPDGSGDWYQNDSEYKVTDNVTFYAQWARDKVPFTLSHTVSGNMADRKKPFTFFLDVTNEDGTHHNQPITDSNGKVILPYDPDCGKHKVTLQHNGAITVELPLGTKVQVSQNPEADYSTTHGKNKESLTETGHDHGVITLPESTTVHFNNHKEATVPTGLQDHNGAIHGLILSAGIVVLLFGAIFALRRRMNAI